jgi:hypothetical protein
VRGHKLTTALAANDLSYMTHVDFYWLICSLQLKPETVSVLG